MELNTHKLILRMPKDLWFLYKKAALYGGKSTTQVICEALESRKIFVEKRYIPPVDKKK